MFKVNNKDTRTMPLAPCFTPCSSVSIVNFEQVNFGWVRLEYPANKCGGFDINFPSSLHKQ